MSESNPNVEVLLELKSAVLNIDWEISDETLAELAEEVTKLQDQWVDKKVLLVYLQILGALCQYIRVSREKAHPGTFVLLKETFQGLEDLLNEPDLPQPEQNKNVMFFAQRYNQLKKEITEGDFIPGPPEDEEKSTTDQLLGDEEGHGADTVFDSMLHAMVEIPEHGDSDSPDGETEPESEPESEPENEPEPPKAPPARPPVQAAFNKADGTEIEPDRNENGAFAEADELLDDFFDDDDDIPAPTAATEVDDESVPEDEEDIGVFNLDELQEEDEEESLRLAREEESLKEDGYVEMDLTGASENEEDGSSVVEDEAGGLVIDIDEESSESEEPEDSFEEMEEALDDFFGDEEGDDDLLDPVSEEAEDDLVIDEALDDFFGEDDDEDVRGASPDDASDSLEPQDEGDSEEIVVDVEEEMASEALKQPAISPENTADEFVADDGPNAEGTDSEPALVADEDDHEDDAEDVEPEEVHPESKSDPGACVGDLKMLLLSVDWEVDDQLLLRLEEKINHLFEAVKDNAGTGVHLSLLRTVTRYIGRDQAEVIGDSMTCLKLIADSLENLIQDETGNSSRFRDEAVQSFVDWHELVVLDFEHRLAACRTAPEQQVTESKAPSSDTGDLSGEVEDPPLTANIKGLKEDILKEVKELIVKEMSDLKS